MTAAVDASIREVLGGPEGPRIAAFFDFDGTLVDGLPAGGFPPARLPSRVRRLRSRSDPRTLAGRREEELVQAGERAFTGGLAGRLRREAWALVQAHRRMGHTLVLVSCVTRYQVAPLARALGIEHILCTTLETAEGVITGRLTGPPLRGPAKAEAVREFAAAHDIDLESSHGYADAFDDLPFLEALGRPCAINPAPELSQVAAWYGWPTLALGRRRHPEPLALVRSLAAAYGGALVGAGTGLGIALQGSDRRRAGEDALMMASEAFLRIAGARLRVEGREHLWSSRPAVFVFNHQSALDIPVVLRLMERDYSSFAKAELAKIPGLAHAFRAIDVTFVDRAAAVALDGRDLVGSAVKQLNQGISLLIAPEGTRSLTPMPGPFKKGAFLIARRAGVPVVPIVIANAGQLMWRNARTVRAGQIDVTVHRPIDVATWKPGEFRARVEDVRKFYVDTLVNG